MRSLLRNGVVGVHRYIGPGPEKRDYYRRHSENRDAGPSDSIVDVGGNQVKGQKGPEVAVGVKTKGEEEEDVEVSDKVTAKRGRGTEREQQESEEQVVCLQLSAYRGNRGMTYVEGAYAKFSPFQARVLVQRRLVVMPLVTLMVLPLVLLRRVLGDLQIPS